MKLKFKNLTLLTLLFITIPFISFTPLQGFAELGDDMAEDVSEVGDHIDIDGTDVDLDDLSPADEDAVAKWANDEANSEKLEQLSEGQLDKINKIKGKVLKTDANAEADIKNWDSIESKTGPDIDTGGQQVGGDGTNPISSDENPLGGDDGDELDANSEARIKQYNDLKEKTPKLEKKFNDAQKEYNAARESDPKSEETQRLKQEMDNAQDDLYRNREDLNNLKDDMSRYEQDRIKGRGRFNRVLRNIARSPGDLVEVGGRVLRRGADSYHDMADTRFRSDDQIREQARLREQELPDKDQEIADKRDEISKAKLDGKDTTDLERQLDDLEGDRADIQKKIRSLDSMDKRIGRAAEYTVKKIFSAVKMFVGAFVMLIGQALAFTVPSALYQMTVAKEARMALLSTISDVQPFGKLWLQIPPQLIDTANPTGSAYLYCEVPSNSKQPASYFNSQFLRTANFYVTGAPQQSFWGTSYIGGAQFNGQMVCLNNGFVFVGGGDPVNYSSPTTALVPTIEEFASGFVTKTSANTFHHTSDAADWVKIDSISLSSGAKNTFHDPIIKAILLSPQVSQYAATGKASTVDNLPGTGGGQLPPSLFYTTINQFRTPTTLPGFGGLKLRQMQGTGFLNIILDNKIDTTAPDLKAALIALANLDRDYKASLSISSAGAVSYGQAELTKLKQAQEAVAQAIGKQEVDTPDYGFSPDGNLNAHNLFVYEIDAQHAHDGTMTPSLHELLKNQPNSFIPLKEYVVCLKGDGRTIIPLLVPEIITSNLETKNDSVKGSASIKGATLKMVLNREISYISSLTTGLTYQKNAGTQTVTNAKGVKMSDVKLLTPFTDSDTVDFSMATGALANTERLLGASEDIGTGAMSQIVAMANYTTDAAVDGPFRTYNGNTFTRVPLLELLGGDPVYQQYNRIVAMGSVLSNASNAADQNAKYSSWSEDQKKQYLSKFYVYKVTTAGGGALASGIPDYVVPVGGATTGKFEILPLGTNQITGGLGTHGVQGVFSLITGQGFDTDYEPLPLWYTVNMHPLKQGSYFPIRGEGRYGYQSGEWAGEQDDQIHVDKKNAQGQMERVKKTIRVIPDVYMGTAFMPTQYNPANRKITNTSLAQQYDTTADAVLRYGREFQSMTAGIQGLNAGTKEYAFGLISKYGAQKASAELEKAQFSEDRIQALIAASSADVVSANLEQAQNTLTRLNKIVNTEPDVTIWKNSDLVLDVPPLYFLFFTGFSFCSQGGQSVTVSPAGQQESSSGKSTENTQAVQSQTIRWPMVKPCQNATSLVITHGTGNVNGSLMSALPVEFSGFNMSQDLSESAQSGPLKEPKFYKGVRAKSRQNSTGTYYPSILALYTEWSLTQDRTNYWAQTGFLGPFNFTQRQYGNVYITATSRQDVSKGNFFYHASGFPPTDIFVFAMGPEDGKVKSLSQLSGIGRPYTDVAAGRYLINVGTGQLYTPYVYPGAKSGEGMESVAPFVCFNQSVSGKECSLQPVGQSVLPGGPDPAKGNVPAPTRTGTQVRFNPREVLAAALTTQRDIGQTVSSGAGLTAAFSTLSDSLQRQLNTAMQSAQQQIQRSLYPVYFGGLTLTMSEESINAGTYIYAVTPKGKTYDTAVDYVVVADISQGNLQSLGAQAVTPYTQSMISLVSGTRYEASNISQQNFMGKVFQSNGVGREQSVPRRLMQLMQGEAKVVINVKLAQRIINLNSMYMQQARSLQDSGSLLNKAPMFPMEALAHERGVTEPVLKDLDLPSSNLVYIGGKYFLKAKTVIPNDSSKGGMPTLYTWFDFNATNEQADANVGIYYAMPENKQSTNLTPTSALTGFELEAMRASHGVVVEPNGQQSLTIPVSNLPLPTARGEQNLVAGFGENGVNMKLVPNIKPTLNEEKGEKYWYYYNRVTQAYYVLVQDITGMRYGGGEGKDNKQPLAGLGYFVDLMSGNEYYVNGQPRMTNSTVAYSIGENERKEEVINVEQPLFIWGEANNINTQQTLNVLGNAGQGYTQYMYVPFTTTYRFENADKTQTMFIGYEIKGTGASEQVVPMRRTVSKGSEPQSQELNVPKGIDTQGMSQSEIAEVAVTAAIEQTEKSGWSLYETEYKVSSGGMPYGEISLTEAPGEAPKQYKFGTARYLEGGVKGFKYPLADSNTLTQALVQGRSFVGLGMGNRQSATGMPGGTPDFGATICGVLDATQESMLGFVPTSKINFYLIGQNSLPRPGQFADYQSQGASVPGLVTNYSVTGQKSPSGVAVQSSYIALQAGQESQSIYSFAYSYAGAKKLAELKSTVNVLTNADGNLQLTQALDARSRTNVTIPPHSIGNYLFGFAKPEKTVMYKIPPLHVAEQYFEDDKTQYSAGGGNTISAIEMFNDMVSTFGVGTYVDYFSGAVFEVKKDNPNYLYPNGFSISGQGLNLIRKQFGGATVEANSLTLLLPGKVETAITKAMGGYTAPPSAPGTTSGSLGVQQNSGRRPAPMAPGARRLPPPAPRTRSDTIISGGAAPTTQQSGRSTPPQAPGHRMPQQSMGVAFMDLKNKALSFMNKLFGQRVIT